MGAGCLRTLAVECRRRSHFAPDGGSALENRGPTQMSAARQRLNGQSSEPVEHRAPPHAPLQEGNDDFGTPDGNNCTENARRFGRCSRPPGIRGSRGPVPNEAVGTPQGNEQMAVWNRAQRTRWRSSPGIRPRRSRSWPIARESARDKATDPDYCRRIAPAGTTVGDNRQWEAGRQSRLRFPRAETRHRVRRISLSLWVSPMGQGPGESEPPPAHGMASPACHLAIDRSESRASREPDKSRLGGARNWT